MASKNDTVDYSIDYTDERFDQVEADKSAAVKEVNKTYDGMIGNTDKAYNGLINATDDYAKTQTELQEQRGDLTVEKLELEQAEAAEDYTKEQKAAYADYQKATNRYGVNAEQMASNGMWGSGYSESSLSNMYNAYQNRVATARESYNDIVAQYNIAIKDAQLQNSSVMAEIAFNALQTRLNLTIENLQYNNNLLMQKTNTLLDLDNTFYNRRQDVINQINTENALAENIRQFGLNYDLAVDEFNETVRSNKANEDYRDRALEEEIRQFGIDDTYRYDVLAEDIRMHDHTIDMDDKNYTLDERRVTLAEGEADKDDEDPVIDKDDDTLIIDNPIEFTGDTYSSAVYFMEKRGVPASVASGVMTKQEWLKRKSGYSSYADYLKDFCAYAVENLKG